MSMAAVVGTVLIAFILTGCGSSKGFRFSIETGRDSDQKNVEAAADQPNFFVSDDTKKLPEITGDEYEQMGDALLGKGNLYLAYVNYEKSLKLKPDNVRVEYKKGLALLLGEKNDDAIRQFELVKKKTLNLTLPTKGWVAPISRARILCRPSGISARPSV